jgi:hypothetical protein
MGREESALYLAETKYSSAWEALQQSGYSAKVEKPSVVSFMPPGTSKTIAGPEMLKLSHGR